MFIFRRHVRATRCLVSILFGIAGLVVSGCAPDTAPQNNRALISLVSSDTVDTADGSRQVQLAAQVDTAFRLVNSTVSFAATAGSFGNGTVTATTSPDESGVARVNLRAPGDSSDALIVASVVGVTRSLVIHFLPAPPTWITVAPASFQVASGVGSSVSLTATIGRVHGTPSSGTPIAFAFRVLGGGPLLGHLTANLQYPGTGGATQLSFVLDSPDTGTVRVLASATRGLSTVSDSVDFRVVSKGNGQ